MLLHERLHAVAGRFPDKVALGFAEERLTFTQLDRRSRALAATFRDWGVRPGDRVGLLADPCAAVVVAFGATLYAGPIAVHLNEQLSPEALGDILDDCEPALVVVSRHYAAATVAQLRPSTRTGRILVVEQEVGLFARPAHGGGASRPVPRAEEHTSELQSHPHLVCRLLFGKTIPHDVSTDLRTVGQACPARSRC